MLCTNTFENLAVHLAVTRIDNNKLQRLLKLSQCENFLELLLEKEIASTTLFALKDQNVTLAFY